MFCTYCSEPIGKHIPGMVSIHNFTLTAGDNNRYRYTMPQPIDRSIGILNRPYCPDPGHCSVESSIGSWLRHHQFAWSLTTHESALLQLGASSTYQALSVEIVPDELGVGGLPTRWCEDPACNGFERHVRVTCRFFLYPGKYPI